MYTHQAQITLNPFEGYGFLITVERLLIILVLLPNTCVFDEVIYFITSTMFPTGTFSFNGRAKMEKSELLVDLYARGFCKT